MYVWNGSTYYLKKGKVLKPGLGGTGHYTVSLRGKTHKVACLVANSFLEKSSDTDYVNHIDGDKKNDNISNLEFISPSQNTKHAYVSGLNSSKSYQKLTYEQKCEISFFHKMGIAYTTIHKNNTYGVTKSAIQRVCNDFQKYTDSVEFELADAAIRLLDLAGYRHIAIEEFTEDMIGESAESCNDESFTESIYSISTIPVKFEYEYDYLFGKQLNSMLLAIIGLAKHLDIDLFWHIEQKMKYNQSRERMHGKKY